MTLDGSSYLLDTHILVWLSAEIHRIPRAVLQLLENPDNRLYVSTICFWEIAIKRAQGRFDAAVNLQEHAASRGIEELPINSRYVRRLAELPMLHGDPFDRMMVAQAIEDRLVLVTADRRLREYPVPILHV